MWQDSVRFKTVSSPATFLYKRLVILLDSEVYPQRYMETRRYFPYHSTGSSSRVKFVHCRINLFAVSSIASIIAKVEFVDMLGLEPLIISGECE